MSAITFSQTLADIDNPTPVLLVCDRHSERLKRLATASVMPQLKNSGYSHFFAEQNPAEQEIVKTLKGVLNGRQIKRLKPRLMQDNVGIMFYETWQADEVGLTYVRADSKSAAHNLDRTKLEDAAIMGRAVNAINKTLLDAVDGDKEKVDFLAAGVHYAAIGPVTFNNYLITTSHNETQRHAVETAGGILRNAYTDKYKLNDKNLAASVRNYDFARQIAETHKKSPNTKLIGTFGAAHISNGVGKAWEGSALLPDILRDRYAIDSVCIDYVSTRGANRARNNLIANGIKCELLDVTETMQIGSVLTGSTPAEFYFAITNKTVTQGIHRLGREAGLENLDYAIGLPDASEDEVDAAVFAGIKRTLKI